MPSVRYIAFTPKEKELVNLLLKGYTNRDISEAMGISTNTVKTHLKNVFNKREVNSRQKLILSLLT